jgi:tetratricopeptide (TPR) repeat protein
MNKKVIFLSAGIMMSVAAFAQKDKLREAKNNLETATSAPMQKAPDLQIAPFTKAKEAIDLAVTNADTKDKPETWQTKAGIYIGMQGNPKLNADNPYKEGVVALKKAIELNSKLGTDASVIQMLMTGSFYGYNDGINEFNAGHYANAYMIFKQSAELLGSDKDKRFILTPEVDTIRAKSVMYAGRNAYYAALAPDAGNKSEMLTNAITNLNAAKNSPYITDEERVNIYLNLAPAYEALGDKANQAAVIKEALGKYPDDKNLKNMDLNLSIAGGSKEEALTKMQAAADKDPSNAEYQMNLGMLYYDAAYPKGGATNANTAGYAAKSEAAYLKTVSLAPENGTYNFQVGSFYYNNASRIIGEMNSLGTSKADQAKYDQLNKDKDEQFKKSLPYLEKAKDIFNAKRIAKQPITTEEGREFVNALTGLKEIYSRMDQPEKSAEVKKLLNEVTQ